MKILLVQTGFIGDVVLSTGVIRSLRQVYPSAEIVLLTTPVAAPLLRGHADLSRVIVFDKRGKDRSFASLFRVAGLLREEGFSLAFSLHKSFRTALLLFLARIPKRYGFEEASASFLYTKTARRKDLDHEALRNLALLRVIGHEPEELHSGLCLSVEADADAQAESVLGDAVGKPLVVLAPGSVWPTKRWTAEGFAETAGALHALGYTIVLIGGKDDANVAEEILKRSAAPLVNVVGKTDLRVSAALIARAKLLISNDSAPLHIGSACGTPVLAVFCATVPEFGFAPWQVPFEVVGLSRLSCRPCARHGGKTCPTGTHACQKELKATPVIDAARRLLKPDESLETARG